MGFFKKLFSKSKQFDESLLSNNYDYYPENLRKSCELDDKYWQILQTHFKLLKKIKMNYTIVMNLGDEFSPQIDKVIQDCKTDISLAPEIYNYYSKRANLDNMSIEYCIPTYDSFKRLAIIYEKRKEYQKAIDVCQKAIEIGFYKDGTDGQMPGRMARLYKKMNKLG